MTRIERIQGSADGARAAERHEADVRENMWIEIIRHMERLYAELAQSQAESERRNAELLEAKQFVENILRSMVNVLVVADRWGVVTLVNEAAADLFGGPREGWVLRPLKSLFEETAAPPARAFAELWGVLLETGSVKEQETVARRADGTAIPVGLSGSVLTDATGEIVGVVLVVRDLRETKRLLSEAAAAAEAERVRARQLAQANEELRRLQDQLIQAEKMSSLGRLAAGVAHELNNPLGGIVVYSHLLAEDCPEGDPRRENIDKIVRLSLRCREIVQDLLGFARPPKSGEERLDLNQVLRRAMEVFAGQALFHNIDVEWSLKAEAPWVMGDAGQLQQAFANIILNAAQAMAAQAAEGRGRLTLATRLAADERAVLLTITDTGPGIRSEDLPHLFEPFFTTKEAGQGTGLGLAITYGIVQRHRGKIAVESPPGQGASFTITLPLAREATPRE